MGQAAHSVGPSDLVGLLRPGKSRFGFPGGQLADTEWPVADTGYSLTDKGSQAVTRYPLAGTGGPQVSLGGPLAVTEMGGHRNRASIRNGRQV